MRRPFMWVLVALFAVPLLFYIFTYTVRFTEAGVLTFFGEAGTDAVKREPGLHFKWPYPIESVTKYDTRMRVMPMKLETQQTADNRQITVELFCFWRVDDPLKFFQRFSNAGARAEDHYAAAEKVLTSNIRASAGLVSKYRMNELFSDQAGGSKLPEFEGRILAALTKAADQSGLSLTDYGVTATVVGVSRVVLPETVTTAVFEAMKQRRLALAQETQSKGEAQASSIRSRAESDAKRIRAFAEQRADTIRTQGDRESAPFLAQMNANSELAVFLSEIRLMDSLSPKAATLVLPGNMPGLNLLLPNAMDNLKAGQIPVGRLPSAGLAEKMKVIDVEGAKSERPASGEARPAEGRK